jgi:hypothetical protein
MFPTIVRPETTTPMPVKRSEPGGSPESELRPPTPEAKEESPQSISTDRPTLRTPRPITNANALTSTPQRQSHNTSHTSQTSLSISAAMVTSAVTPPTVTVAPAASATSTSLTSTAAGRTVELRTALSKMLYILTFVNLIFLASIAADLPSCFKYLSGEVVSSDVTPPDPASYTALQSATVWIQQLALGVLVWYAWTPTTIWSSAKMRAERGTPFWKTVLHGLPPEATRTTDRRYERKEQEQVTMGRPSVRGHMTPVKPV